MRAQQLLDRLSVEDKVGQLICTSIGHSGQHDASDLDRVRAEIADLRLGGVCYFPGGRKAPTPEQVSTTTNALQAERPAAALLISVDQEGGRVARLRSGFSLFGSAMAMAALQDPAAVRDAAQTVAEEVRAVGICQVLAPIADVNSDPANPVIGTRSFGSDPAAVARLVAAAVEGYRAGGVAATAKHFPGHGDTAADSHLSLPVLQRSLSQLRSLELIPFRAAIAAGVEVLMSGHLVVPDLGPQPATYSSAVLDLLRADLGFTGVVSTDALDMVGALTGRDPHEAAVDALLAGADQLLMPVGAAGAVAALLRALQDGRLSETRLDESCLRVLRLKERLGLLDDPVPPTAAELARVGGQQQHAVWLAARSTTAPAAPVKALAAAESVALLGEPGPFVTALAGELEQAGHAVVAPERAGEAQRVVIVSSDTRSVAVGSLAASIAEHPGAVIIVSGTPYQAALLPPDRAILLSYGDNATQALGAALVLLGRATPSGVLPVDVVDRDGRIRYARGTGGD